MSLKKEFFPSINGLRAISIILVIFNHLLVHGSVFFNTQKYGLIKPFTDFLTDGQLGVNVFFVISGFLITSLLISEEKNTGKISLKNFYIRRTLRIFPAYFFLLLVYFLFQSLNFLYISPISWFTAVTYTKYFNWGLDWPTAHAWSLSIEEHFYFLWPLIFVFIKKYRNQLILLIAFLVPVIRVVLYFYPVLWLDDHTFITRIDSIAIGCIFSIFKNEILNKIKNQWNAVFYISVFLIFSIRYFPQFFKPYNLNWIFIPLGTTFGTLANLAIALILMYSVFGPKNIWFRFINSKVLNYIGMLSYSIYLWQQIFIFGFENKKGHWFNSYPENLIFIFIAAYFSYTIIEKPFLRLKSKFID